MNLPDLDRLVQSFGHIVDGQSRNRRSCHRLHLDTCSGRRGRRRGDFNSVLSSVKLECDVSQRDLVTQRDQVGGLLRGCDA